MTWRDQHQRHPWRDFLTEEEAGELADLKAQSHLLKVQRQQVSGALQLIRNRACQRARAAQPSSVSERAQ